MPIKRAQVRVKGEFWEGGSVLADTVVGGCTRISMHLSIESSGEEDRVARLVRNAESLCFAEQTIVKAAPIELSIVHNGNQVEVGADAGAGG